MARSSHARAFVRSGFPAADIAYGVAVPPRLNVAELILVSAEQG